MRQGKMAEEQSKKIKGHKDLEVWKKSMDIVESIYKDTARFPKEEIYGITAQMRRAAVSIPSNIAEGAARNGKKEFVQFLYIALGSLSELETQIIITERLRYIPNVDSLINECSIIKKLLNGLIISLTKNVIH
jgi:four helix bundle protein